MGLKTIPPPTTTDSVQLELFKGFYGSEISNASNFFTVWDLYPIYCVTRHEQSLIKRVNDGLLNPIKHDFTLKGEDYLIEIFPAILKNGEGRREFFPSEREELVEHAIRKILIQQHDSIHHSNKATWVKFTIRQLKNELQSVGRSMDTNRIKESLNIMRGTRIKVTRGRQKTFDSNILSSLIITNRQEYEATGKSECAVQFNSLINYSITKLEFRQMNYRLFMKCKHGITRWLFKVLVVNFINAGDDAPPFKILASEVVSGCRLNYKRKRNIWGKIRNALEEIKNLKTNDGDSAIIQVDSTFFDPITSKESIIKGVTESPIKQGAKTTDILFNVRPSKSFIKFMKASNKRVKNYNQVVTIGSGSSHNK